MTGTPGLLTRIFVDTDVVDDGRLMQPISLALVSETGPEYYAVFAGGGMNAAPGNEWLRAHVIPHPPVTDRDHAPGAGPARAPRPA